MTKHYKLAFALFLIFISMVNPGCKHDVNNGSELHTGHMIKPAVVIGVKAQTHN